MFDEADRKPGYRILYLGAMSAALCMGAALANVAVALLAWFYGEKIALHLIFFIAAGVTLLIAANGFRIYRGSRSPV
jgi:hypothetical protein